jgi:hypothetical protein
MVAHRNVGVVLDDLTAASYREASRALSGLVTDPSLRERCREAAVTGRAQEVVLPRLRIYESSSARLPARRWTAPSGTWGAGVRRSWPYPLDIAPGQRYRCEQWAPYLAEQGIDLVLPFATSLQERLYAGRLPGPSGRWCAALRRIPKRGAPRYDAVWSIARRAWWARPGPSACPHRRPALVYDFDDAVYRAYVSPTNRYLSYLKFPGKTRTLCRLAGAVIAGNEHLADYARRYNPRVHVVPSTITLRAYRPRPGTRPEGPPVIGWTGSHSSAQSWPWSPARFSACDAGTTSASS